MIDPADRLSPPLPASSSGNKRRGWFGRIWRRVAIFVAAYVLLTSLWVLIYRIVPPPGTPLMLIRWVEDGTAPAQDWQPDKVFPDHLKRAVIAAEDARFCLHRGFDWKAIEQAWDRNQSGKKLRGGSTISMQTAKNIFLWHGEARWARWLRKGFEAYFTLLIEYGWGKDRILEIYLNVAEWGPGIYGASAASNYYFKKPVNKITRHEAALLAAVLPNPRRFNAGAPSGYVLSRANTIQARMNDIPDYENGTCAR